MVKEFNPDPHITDLRGKKYLEVKWRIVWFRSAHPSGTITTDIVSTDPLVVRARILNGDGQELATGHGTANAQGKTVWTGREVEKAETAAIGRALAHCGFGTQFTGEDEGDNLADSPQDGPRAVDKPAQSKAQHTPTKATGPRYEYEPVIAFTQQYLPERDDAINALKDMKKAGVINDGMTTEQVNAEVRRKLGPPLTDAEVAQAFEDLGKAG